MNNTYDTANEWHISVNNNAMILGWGICSLQCITEITRWTMVCFHWHPCCVKPHDPPNPQHTCTHIVPIILTDYAKVREEKRQENVAGGLSKREHVGQGSLLGCVLRKLSIASIHCCNRVFEKCLKLNPSNLSSTFWWKGDKMQSSWVRASSPLTHCANYT